MQKRSAPPRLTHTDDELGARADLIRLIAESLPGGKPRTPTERHHKLVEDTGRAAVAGWISHPAVAREVKGAGPTLDAEANLLGLADQLAITGVTARLLDARVRWPGGITLPNPFEGATRWQLAVAQFVGPLYVGELQNLAHRLADQGVPLDPLDAGVRLVLAQLALLDVDWAWPPTDIVAGLNVLPPGSVDAEEAALGHIVIHVSRHGRSARFHAALDAIAEDIVSELGVAPIPAPYASGYPRRTPAETAQLRQALAELAARDLSLTPKRLLDAMAGHDHPALARLRETLGWDPDFIPEQRRIERNWPKRGH